MFLQLSQSHQNFQMVYQEKVSFNHTLQTWQIRDVIYKTACYLRLDDEYLC